MLFNPHLRTPADQRSAVVILLLAVALVVLAVCRAVLIPFTHDEALSLAMFSTKSIGGILSYEGAGGMPNNHILNTLWLKFAAATFGESTLSLRLGNILGLLFYLYAAMRFALVLRSPLLRISAFVLLCANPFVFDFFSLARGYGMANGLLLFSVWSLYQWWMHPSQKKAYSVLLSAALMVLANFSAFHVYVALACILIVAGIYRSETKSGHAILRAFLPVVLVSLALAGMLYLPFKAIMHEQGAFGGETGFWNDCAIWLMSFTTYGKPYALAVMQVLPWIIILLLVVVSYVTITLLLKRERNFLVLIFACVVLPVFTMQLQHVLLGTEFPVARTVQYMYPLFILSVVFYMNHFIRLQRAAAVSSGVFALLLAAHFVNAMQCTYVSQWDYDAANRRVLNDLGEMQKAEQQKPLRLGITWIFEPGLNYERNYRNMDWLEPLNRDGVENEYDYYYVISEDSARLASQGKKVLRFYPESRTSLMK